MSGPDDLPSIDGYRVVKRLGHGGMGTVWRAIDRAGRDVAVKLADRMSGVPEAKRDEMFRREALVLLNLRHPSLVRGLEVGETTDGHPFLAMEFVTGKTLRQRFRSEGSLRERELVAVGLALASALEHAHRLGLLHRDVKPENVMLRPDGTVCLVDFGIASESGRGEAGLATPGYASPEVLLKREVGPASDLYSLGVTLASAALGRPYFEGADAKAVARASLREPIVLPETLHDEPVSDGLRAVINRLTRKDPAERYGSAGEARLDFEALSHGERPLGALLGLARLHPARHPWRWLVGGAAVAAAAGIALLATSGRSPATPEPRTPPPATPPVASSVPRAPEDDPRVEAALLYLESHPDEFQNGRRLLAQAKTGSPSDGQRARLEAASERIEARFRAAADALLRERSDKARALAAKGDLAGATILLSTWPSDLAGAPQEAEAKALADSLRTETLAPGERLVAEGAASLDRWQRGGDDDLEAAREFATRLDRYLQSGPTIPEQRARVAALRASVSRAIERLAAARRERSSRDALTSYLARAAENDSDGARAALEQAGDGAADAPEVARLAASVAARGRDVDAVLSRRLAALARRPWAGVLDGRWFVGTLDAPPVPRRVYLPLPPTLSGAASSASDGADLLDVEPDAERAASWLLLAAAPDAAAALAPPAGAARRLLELAGRSDSAHGHRVEGAWADLLRRVPLVVRPPDGAAPEALEQRDPVLDAWREAILASRRAAPRAPSPAPVPSVLAARAAFASADWPGAWTALADAVVASPRDPEVAILRCRVLEVLAKPARTRATSLLALSEARRAWDLDPTVPAAPRLVAEQGLLFRARHPGATAQALAPVTLAACEEAARLGQADAAMLAFAGERRLAESKPKLAVQWLRRAAREAPDDPAVSLLLARAEDAVGESKRAREALVLARDRMGDKFPAWAREMLDRLSVR